MCLKGLFSREKLVQVAKLLPKRFFCLSFFTVICIRVGRDTVSFF